MSNPSQPGPNDFSTAILRPKSLPNRLLIDQAATDDNSGSRPRCWRHDHSTVNPSALLAFGNVLLTFKTSGNNQRDTVLICRSSEAVEEGRIQMNKVVRNNLRVKLGDFVGVHPCQDIEHGKRVDILPLENSIDGLRGNIADVYLTPYFLDGVYTANRALCSSNDKVVSTLPKALGDIVGNIHQVFPAVTWCTQVTMHVYSSRRGRQLISVSHAQGEAADALSDHDDEDNISGGSGMFPWTRTSAPHSSTCVISTGTYIFSVSATHGTFTLNTRPCGRVMLIGVTARNVPDTFFTNGGVSVWIDSLEAAYHHSAYRPVRKGDIFLVRGGMRAVEFQVVETDPAEFCIVAPDTVIHTEGPSVKREDGEPTLADMGFDHEVDIGVPGRIDRLEILRIHIRNLKLAEDVNLEQIAADTHGYVGADIVSLCSEAAMQQFRENLHLIDLDDDTIDVEVLNSLLITMDNFRFALRTGLELLTMRFNEPEANVCAVFNKARAAAPARGSDSGSRDDRVLNQILMEMDSTDANKNLSIIGVTNSSERLDLAVLRPGRLDRVIYIPLPDEPSRLSIMKKCLKNSPVSPDVDLVGLARSTTGFSGADLTEICQRAAKVAIRESIEVDIRRAREKRAKDDAAGENEEIVGDDAEQEDSVPQIRSKKTVKKRFKR
ncbi:hypothetical protein K438DRAFT_1943996 [Mycena galopus ATCC 62051]|nr:hypothetical protein K438DRAFT_1943996 [Mycena galopus ATCC 62051]